MMKNQTTRRGGIVSLGAMQIIATGIFMLLLTTIDVSSRPSGVTGLVEGVYITVLVLVMTGRFASIARVWEGPNGLRAAGVYAFVGLSVGIVSLCAWNYVPDYAGAGIPRFALATATIIDAAFFSVLLAYSNTRIVKLSEEPLRARECPQS